MIGKYSNSIIAFIVYSLLVTSTHGSVQKSSTQEPLPIIDMHCHSYEEGSLYGNGGALDYWGNPGSASVEALFRETYEQFRRLGVVKAVVSGHFESVQEWKLKDLDNRIICGIRWNEPGVSFPDPNVMGIKRFEELVIGGQIQVFGEIGAIYGGNTLNDPGWQPYLEICERYDIPVCYHTGSMPPGTPLLAATSKARLSLGNPYLIEDVLVKYPKLRVWMCHSADQFHEHALSMMCVYPNLYMDLGASLWMEPICMRYGEEFVRKAKQAGVLHKVFFGSDQCWWPHAIKASIDRLNSFDFLTAKDKRDILYNNAAKFLSIEQ